jgi:hypothetical protein
MKKFIITIVLCVIFSKLHAQVLADSIKKNSVYVELLGSSPLLYNVTYDRLLSGEGKFRTSVALGFQYIFDREIDGFLNSDFSMTPQFNLLFGRKHFFELGVGAAFQLGNAEAVVFPIRLGYRFQKDEGGLFFKAAFTPLYIPGDGFYGYPFLPWGGLSAGYTF